MAAKHYVKSGFVFKIMCFAVYWMLDVFCAILYIQWACAARWNCCEIGTAYSYCLHECEQVEQPIHAKIFRPQAYVLGEFKAIRATENAGLIKCNTVTMTDQIAPVEFAKPVIKNGAWSKKSVQNFWKYRCWATSVAFDDFKSCTTASDSVGLTV